MLKDYSTKDSSFYNKLVLDLHKIMSIGILFKYSKTKNPWKDEMTGNTLFVTFVRRNPGLALREAENLSCGYLMRFDRNCR
jgi:hypothetical protein